MQLGNVMARIMPTEYYQSGKRNGADGCLLCSTDAIHPTAQRPCVGWKQPAVLVPGGRWVLHGTSFIIAACGWIRRPRSSQGLKGGDLVYGLVCLV